MAKLDRTRNIAQVGIRHHTLLLQDDKYFDPITDEEIDVNTLKDKPQEKTQPDKKLEAKEVYTCKLCGATRPDQESFLEHLQAKHAEEIKQKPDEPKEPEKTVDVKLDDLSVSDLKEKAKSLNISKFKDKYLSQMNKTELIEAIQSV